MNIDNSQMVMRYVTGMGWCYMQDGEIIEIIESMDGEGGVVSVHSTSPNLLSAFLSLDRGYVVLDTETTDIIKDGVYPDIVTVGLIKVGADRVFSEPVEFKVRPYKPMHPLAQKVHGISDQEAATFPELTTHWNEISQYLAGEIVVIHNADFDWSILNDHIDKYDLARPVPDYVFCSQKHSTAWAKSAGISGSSRGPSLDKLTKYFNIEDRREALGGIHGAANDAWQTAMVVEALRDIAVL